MEEVDSIILHFLKQLDITISEDAKGLCDLSVETIIESASKCLTSISSGLKLPATLPSGISHRIEVAAQIASACKDLGYKNDVGYQTFLYYNETELRQVFMFLIEHLPSEGAQSAAVLSPSNKKSQFLQQISQKIAEELNSMWIPPCCNKNNVKTIGDGRSLLDNMELAVPINTSHLNEEELIQHLLKFKPKDVEAVIEQTVEARNTETEGRKDPNKSLKELKEITIVLGQKLNVMESERNVMDVEFQQINKSLEKAEAELKTVKNILINIGMENINDSSSDNILDNVQHNIQMLHMKSEELTSNNLELNMKIDMLRNNNSLSESERSRCRKILTSLKDTAKAMKDEYNNKEQMKDQLKRNYEKLKGGNKRSVYTKRILEIIGNVDKQNLEIAKILEDTRQLQKEINSLEGQLDRCFSIADETLFGDAKKDDQAKKAYKLLALLHSECNTIVSLVNDTGSLAREIVDLEDNIKGEQTKRTEDTLEKIRLDITRMREESNT